MPKPTVRDVHVNRPLTNISIAYVQNANNFIADKVFPVVPVESKSDLYWKYSRADFFRNEAKKRAPGTESAGGGYALETDSYNCEVEAFHKDIDDQTRANYDSELNADRDGTIFVTQKLLIAREVNFYSNFMQSGIWGTTVDGATTAGTGEVAYWNDGTSGDPIANIDTAIATIMSNTGYAPNRLVLGFRVFQALKNHPDIVDRVKFVQNIGPNQAAKVTSSILADLFFDGLPGGGEVVIGAAVQNTANDGATEATDFIGGDDALLVYANPSPSLMTPSGGYTMNWRGYMGNPQAMKIKKFRMDWLESDRIEGCMAYDQKLVASELGYYFNNIISLPA
ncbi:MAG: major capsid protein [Smithella sp.]